MMLIYKRRKNSQSPKGNRLLISMTVLGSAGPIRFVVREDELIATVIQTALKSYAREGRLPVLGSDLNSFMLYCPIAGTEALHQWEKIGSIGVRNFVLCKNPRTEEEDMECDKASTAISRKGAGSWRAWFHKSLNLKITSH